MFRVLTGRRKRAILSALSGSSLSIIRISMILKTEEVEARLRSPLNISPLHVSKDRSGVVPECVRELAGSLALAGESQSSVAETFGLTQPGVGKYSLGLKGQELDEDFRDKVESGASSLVKAVLGKKDRAHDLALDSLVSSLSVIGERFQDPKNVDGIRTSELSKIASNLSRISKDLTGDSNEKGPRVQVQVFVPTIKREAEYDVIEVG